MSAPNAILTETAKSYKAIVDNVIEALRLQFENTGKDTAILEVLKKTWIAKFNQANVLGGLDLDKLHLAMQPQQPAITAYSQQPGAGGIFRPHAQPMNSYVGSGGILGSVPMPMSTYPNVARPLIPGVAAVGPAPMAQYGVAGPGALPAIAVPQKPGGVLVAPVGVGQRAPTQPQPVATAPPPQMPLLPPKAEAKTRSRALDDEELGSDDDDDDFAELGQDDPDAGAGKARNTVLCLFEKVTRVKNKRRVTLRDGLMKIEGKEYIFNKCTGEFDW